MKLQCITVRVGLKKKKKKKFPIFAQNPVSQSHSLPQGRGFKIVDARGREIFLRINLKNFFVTTYGTSVRQPRLFVTAYGTSVRRKRVKRQG